MEEVVRVLGLQLIILHLSGLRSRSDISSGNIIERLIHERIRTGMEWKKRSRKIEEC